MKLKELFEVRNGVASSTLSILPYPKENTVPYIRPASTQQRTVSGWVDEKEIGAKNIYPEGTLFVSTNGEGSHSYSYVSRFRFACNSDVSVLLPYRKMTLNEKIYYARCITMNRYKFSYGRKPKGNRLKHIELPDTLPKWITDLSTEEMKFPTFEALKNMTSVGQIKHTSKQKLVKISELFDVHYGTNLELNALELNPEGINFVSRSGKNNGISARVSLIPNVAPIPGGVLSVAGSGSVLETFLQQAPFYSGYHLFYLIPKEKMSSEELLFYAHCIRENRFRYSYGRQANRTLKDLLIPGRDSVPFWVKGSIKRVAKQVEDSLYL